MGRRRPARVTRAETDGICAALRGPKQRQDFPGSGHEPYWWKHKALWESTIQQFLAYHQFPVGEPWNSTITEGSAIYGKQ